MKNNKQILLLSQCRGVCMKVVNQLGYIRCTVREYSQEQLARISGVSRHTISEIELNKRVPELRTALLLARALKCPVEDIFFLKE